MGQRLKCLPAMRENWVRSLGWEDPLEKEMVTHSSILAWKSHGWRSLVGYSSRGCKELDTTEQLHFRLFIEGDISYTLDFIDINSLYTYAGL